MPGTWQAQPITIDGDSKDWPSPYPNYDAKAMVAYATANDKENLYITMETGDEMTQMKILKLGMTVSIDTSGKKEPEFTMNYPLPNEDLEIPKRGDAGSNNEEAHFGRSTQQKISKATREANQFSLDGFGACNGGYLVTQTTRCGIKIRMSIDEYKEMVWEAVIPFKALYNRDTIDATYLGKPISVCFAVKGFKHPDAKGSESSNTGMNNGMGGGMNSSQRGGRGGSRSGGAARGVASNPMEHLYESTKTWKQFGLAWLK